jgi:hypothetical protein
MFSVIEMWVTEEGFCWKQGLDAETDGARSTAGEAHSKTAPCGRNAQVATVQFVKRMLWKPC